MYAKEKETEKKKKKHVEYELSVWVFNVLFANQLGIWCGWLLNIFLIIFHPNKNLIIKVSLFILNFFNNLLCQEFCNLIDNSSVFSIETFIETIKL